MDSNTNFTLVGTFTALFQIQISMEKVTNSKLVKSMDRLKLSLNKS